jgi:peptidoglycan/xylan/chitin deacetylase (PgdA/CDA1 family)
LTRLPDDQPNVSLTFDDGPNPVATPIILDALKERRVRATFFFLGRHVERWPELAARAAADGHQLGNHGYYHRKLHFKSMRYVRDDLTRGKAAIEAATHQAPTHFRAPHGFRSPWVTSIARSLGERTVGWSFGVWDTDCPGPNAIVRRILDRVTPGAILLLHDGDGYNPMGDRLDTAHAVGPLVDALHARGLALTTLPA